MNLIELNDISKQFGHTKAIDKASITFAPNKIHDLLGRNGAGKTQNPIVGFLLSYTTHQPAGRFVCNQRDVLFGRFALHQTKHRNQWKSYWGTFSNLEFRARHR